MSDNRETLEQKRANEALKNYSPVKPGFDGTQPKILHDAQEPVYKPMDELIERDAEKQDTTVTELKVAAFENEANTGRPDPIDGDEAPVDDQEVEGEEEEEVVNLTVAELKAELDAAGIDYPSSALKADLQALYDENNLGQ